MMAPKCHRPKADLELKINNRAADLAVPAIAGKADSGAAHPVVRVHPVVRADLVV
jgi:hypothetical protein